MKYLRCICDKNMRISETWWDLGGWKLIKNQIPFDILGRKIRARGSHFKWKNQIRFDFYSFQISAFLISLISLHIASWRADS